MIIKMYKVVGILAGIVIATSALAQARISGLTVRNEGSGVAIDVKGTDLVTPRAMRVNSGKSFLLEWDAELQGPAQWRNVRRAGVESAHLTWFSAKPPRVRLHLRLRPSDQPRFERSADGWLITVNVAPSRPVVTSSPDERAMKQAIAYLDGDSTLQTPPPKAPKTTKVEEMRVVEVQDQRITPRMVNPIHPVAKPGDPIVSLDFTNTEIVQVLRALAMQANANIVPSPEVKGLITLSLERVSFTQALDFVTAMTGLRYGRVGNTIVVASAARFQEVMRQLGASTSRGPETRVVPIYSGEGAQIKAVILKSVSQDGPDGGFEILLPSEELQVQSVDPIATGPTAPPTGEGSQAGAQQGGTVIQSSASQGSSKERANDPYVVVIGAQEKLDEVERSIRRIDGQICSLLGISVPATSALVQKSYLVQGGSARSLLEAIAGKDGKKVGNVEVVATPQGANSRPVLVLRGRENEVEQVLATLRELDNTESEDTKYVVYDVRFADPRSLREDLIAQIPGLSASIPPASAGNPRIFVPNQTVSNATQRMDENGQPQGGTSTGSTGASSTTAAPSSETAAATNIQQPFSDMEPFAVPMRLILRGTAQQISQAQSYLAAVDIAPKQVAIELRVVEMSKEDALKTGIDWNILGGGAVKILRLNNSNSEPSNTIGMSISGKNWAGDVGATLDKSIDKNRIIARPNMLALDGRETELFIGDVVRYVESIVSGQNGPTITTGEISVGVRLAVLARVGADGNMIMDLRPRVSFLRGFLNLPNNAGQLPQTSERIAQSTISMKSGETIAIGGLIQDQDVKQMSGIPLLMDLPIVGRLFRKETTTKRRSEIVIFLTARSLDGPASSSNDQSTIVQPSKELKKDVPAQGKP
ncbi:MAG TPA: hypothetical protein PLO61_04840 [Fimbriimonadaceae bacterium]|nr:hypothetical protein [Fimbriimonadaceae bacterium]HRJ32546.1 hypothetical protein [Fimbriimonadaceae bacterium]